jgi:hypothetical protein
MSSCTNSSNIQSNLILQTIREEGDGKRVAFKITTADAGISAGVTVGSVIRYDVPSNMYVTSIADSGDNAEVIGIVESIQNSVYTVVASGLIKYPNITSVINRYGIGCTVSDGGTGGDEGGADIYFLSNYCEGKLQLLEPTVRGHIVKPVMQRVAVGEYNGIVLNYIGYEISNDATSDTTEVVPAGTVIFADKTGDLQGYLDVSSERLLDKEKYSELYDVFDTKYGIYRETITLSSPGVNLSTLANSQVTQKTAFNTADSIGKVISGDSTTNKIVVEKTSSQPKTDLERKVSIGNLKFTATASTVTSFTVPSVPKQKIQYNASSGSQEVSLTPYMRTEKDITSVFLPREIILTSLSCDNITTNGVTVGSKLQNLENRVKDLEQRFGI